MPGIKIETQVTKFQFSIPSVPNTWYIKYNDYFRETDTNHV